MSYLDKLTKNDIETGVFPVNKVVDGAVFYSATGLMPEILEDCIYNKVNNAVQDIVYCDFQVGYGEKANDILPLKGYQLFAERVLTKDELFPEGLSQHRPYVLEAFREYPDDNIYGNLYIKWFVFELINSEETKKPKRFSILHIECYGTSIYSSLYYKDELYPEILVIKQPNLNYGNGHDFFHHKISKIGLHQVVTNRHVLSLPEIVYYVELPGRHEDDGFGWKQYEKIGILNNLPENKFGENIYKYKLKLTLERD